MALLILLIGATVGLAVGRWLTRRLAAATLSRAEAEMRRELSYWQEAAARASAEAARIAREAEAYKAGCQHGREDVISIMPLLVAAQQRSADQPCASGDEPPHGR
jgi:hypothetical protein